MGGSEARSVAVAVILGPGAPPETVEHTLRVLRHYGIPFRQVPWRDSQDFLACEDALGVQVVVFETGIAYTDEHVWVPDDRIVPVLRVLTDSAPPPADLLLTTSAGVATLGYGIPGAVNAGLLAARMLAATDPVLRDLLKTKPYLVS